MISRVRPADYTGLLLESVDSARRSMFWRRKLGTLPVTSQADFDKLPFTPIDEYRGQSFASVVAEYNGIEWIPGPWLGQSPDRVPVAEGPPEARVRVDLISDSITPVLPDKPIGSSALVVVESGRRHFGAEMSAVLVRLGIQAHLLTDGGTDRLRTLIEAFDPDIMVSLSRSVDLDTLPESVTGIVTVGRGSNLEGTRHVDLIVQSELGVLGAAFGCAIYEMNHHRFHFEESPQGTLAATPYFSRVQPLIRLDTGLPASVLH